MGPGPVTKQGFGDGDGSNGVGVMEYSDWGLAAFYCDRATVLFSTPTIYQQALANWE